MKKLYVLSFTVLICSITQAQINKGTVVLGGNLIYEDQSYSTGFPGVNSYTNTSTTLGIGASVGKAIKDNLVLGVDLNYDHISANYTPGSSTTGYDLGGGVFLRKYIRVVQGFYVFGEMLLNGNYTQTSAPQQAGSQITADVTNSYGVGIRFSPGIAYALNKKWQLEMGLPNFFNIAYSHSKQAFTYTTGSQPYDTYNSHDWTASAFGGGVNSLTAGVRFFIGN